MAARAGVEPMTLRTKGVDSTNAPYTSHGWGQIKRREGRLGLVLGLM